MAPQDYATPQYSQYGAIAFDEEDCQLGNWKSPFLLSSGQNVSWNDMFSNIPHTNTIESIYVKTQCSLTVYDDSGFRNFPFIFEGPLTINLANPPSTFSVQDQANIKALNNGISSMTLHCLDIQKNDDKKSGISWYEADAKSLEVGGHLLEIISPEDNEIFNLIKDCKSHIIEKKILRGRIRYVLSTMLAISYLWELSEILSNNSV